MMGPSDVLALLACAACAHGAMSRHVASYDIKATLDRGSAAIFRFFLLAPARPRA